MLQNKNSNKKHNTPGSSEANPELLIQSILDSVPNALVITKSNKAIISHFNNSFVQLWQIPAKLVQSYDSNSIFKYLDSKLLAADFFMETMKYLNNNPGEASFKALDLINGSVVECYTTPQWVQNKIVGRIWNFRDISQQKRFEGVLQTQKQELVNAHRIASIGSWTFNIRTKEFSYSESFAQLCDGILAKQSFEKFITVVHPDDVMGVRQKFNDIVAVDTDNKYEFRYRVVNKYDQVFYIKSIIELIVPQNKAKFILGVSQDVSRHALLEISLESAKEAAEDFNTAKGIFLANMSHEMKTPLNAILGYSEILLQTSNDKLQKNYIGSIKSSGESLLSLIEDILYISRIDGQEIKINEDIINIRALIKEVQELFKFKFEEKGLLLKVDIDKDMPEYVVIDRARLKQIFINLISNAHKFTETGFVLLKVEVKKITDSANFELIIFIEDTGIGIKEKDKEKIFESFSQIEGKDKREFEGLGLGLYITKKNVVLLGGNIEVQSAPGIGSLFIVSFKNLKVPAIIDEDNKEDYLDITNIEFEAASILIIDDRDFNRRILKGLLSKFNLKIMEADNGNDAVLMAIKHKPQLIIMDLAMPKMDGYEALKVMRANSKIKNTPIIAFSAHVKEIEKDSLIELGFNDFLSKPISYTKAVRLISKFLPNKISNKQLSNISPETLLEKDIDQLLRNEKLVSSLKKSLFDTWLQLFEKRTSKNQKEFAQKLEQFGNENKLDFIKKLGFSLFTAISVYDIDETKKIMNRINLLFNRIGRKLI